MRSALIFFALSVSLSFPREHILPLYLFSCINGHQGVGSGVDRGQQEVIRQRLRLCSIVYASNGYSDSVILILCHYRTLHMKCSVTCNSFLVCKVRSPAYKIRCCCLVC